MLKWVRALWRRVSEESLAVSQRGAADIIRELRTAALQTEQDSAAAAGGASMAVMNARMVAGMMGEMSSRMAEVNARMAESRQCVLTGVAEARNASTQVAVLTRAVAQIATTAGLIADIARITNLLSLNAAIEAARAGGAGAGFAVVADEVKELSRRTAQATEDIGEQLERIRQAQGAVRASVEVLDGGLTSIQALIASVTGAVDEQSNSLAMVATCSKEAADSVEGLAATLDQIAGIARTTTQKCNDFEAVG